MLGHSNSGKNNAKDFEGTTPSAKGTSSQRINSKKGSTQGLPTYRLLLELKQSGTRTSSGITSKHSHSSRYMYHI